MKTFEKLIVSIDFSGHFWLIRQLQGAQSPAPFKLIHFQYDGSNSCEQFEKIYRKFRKITKILLKLSEK